MKDPQTIFAALSILAVFISSCTPAQTSTPAATSTPTQSSMPASAAQPTQTSPSPAQVSNPTGEPVASAFQTGQYPNLFKELLGKSDAEIQSRLDATWQQLFYGDDNTQRVYYPVGSDMAYIEDIGNGDVRSEGMSYGMMISVQMNKQAEFNRIWKWAKTYMYQKDGPYQGYFAWHCNTDGTQIDANPASDGEEWFVMALFFASGRWGDGQGIFDYQAQANEILHTMLHKEDTKQDIATNMFNLKEKQVVFVPSVGANSFTDPSYHLPAYYELWQRWAGQDQDFWKAAAQASRAFFKKAANPQTGLMPDYANFDGAPHGTDNHKDFRFDAWRVAQNVAIDYVWFNGDPWEVEQSNRWLDFFYKEGIDNYANQYTLDGKPLSTDHSTGLIAMNAVAALAATGPHRKEFVQALWDTSVPTGKWRYYDGLLYYLALLHDSGSFRIYPPKSAAK